MSGRIRSGHGVVSRVFDTIADVVLWHGLPRCGPLACVLSLGSDYAPVELLCYTCLSSCPLWILYICLFNGRFDATFERAYHITT